MVSVQLFSAKQVLFTDWTLPILVLLLGGTSSLWPSKFYLAGFDAVASMF